MLSGAGRGLQGDGEDERGPVEAELLQQGAAGFAGPVEKAADQGATPLALFRLRRGPLVHIGFGHRADQGVVRPERQIDQFDQRPLLVGLRRLP
ncbi:hypothetical protein [Streptomyces sp. NPDC014685]|uniref:hypothetical protein n=1 Tax=Streptomyces sp. NPDC014685 TaxID=3364881 RepID=UPI0036FBD145